MIIAYDKNKERISIRNANSIDKYYCPLCEEELIQKRGNKRCHHFSHKMKSNCSLFKYYDTSEWHLNWQNQFPEENQEIIKVDENGKKHIADVLINNTVIEFQRSNITYDDYNDRNQFYSNLGYKVIWIFNCKEAFNSNYYDRKMYFKDPLKHLRYQETIPEYLSIFVEGTIEDNLFEESGNFLYHVSDIDSETGLLFDWKNTPEEFVNSIKNNIEFKKIILIKEKEEMKFQELEIPVVSENNQNLYNKPGNLVELFERFENTERIVAYNIKAGYDVLLDKDNYLRLKNGKKAYGKIRKHQTYGKFYGDKREIYYAYDNNWVLRWKTE